MFALARSISFSIDGTAVTAAAGANLLAAATAAGVEITSLCGGHGVCGACSVVFPDALSALPVTEASEELLEELADEVEDLPENVRFACQCTVAPEYEGQDIKVLAH
jgi:ferredoxin